MLKLKVVLIKITSANIEMSAVKTATAHTLVRCSALNENETDKESLKI